MTPPRPYEPDPRLDLVLERTLDIPPEAVWKAWTEPEHVKAWFTPAPWTTTECEIDLRPGGRFRTVMRGPEGEEFDGTGCWLEVVEPERLVWTSAMKPGFRPAPASPGGEDAEMPFTAVILLEPAEGGGTRYTAIAMHPDEETRERHEAMGFHDGWGKALDQLEAHAKGMRA